MYDTFLLRPDKPNIRGKLTYLKNEASVDFTPEKILYSQPKQELTLLACATLQILVDIATQRVLYVFGYFPLESARRKQLMLPKSTPGEVYIDQIISLGDNHMSFKSGLLKSEGYYDEDRKLLRVGEGVDGSINIEVATGIIMGFSERKLVCLWLQL
ncbi:MAG: hypothetical protein WAQ24_05060 [Candidatus Saccharimonadales bacterium]